MAEQQWSTQFMFVRSVQIPSNCFAVAFLSWLVLIRDTNMHIQKSFGHRLDILVNNVGTNSTFNVAGLPGASVLIMDAAFSPEGDDGVHG